MLIVGKLLQVSWLGRQIVEMDVANLLAESELLSVFIVALVNVPKQSIYFSIVITFYVPNFGSSSSDCAWATRAVCLTLCILSSYFDPHHPSAKKTKTIASLTALSAFQEAYNYLIQSKQKRFWNPTIARRENTNTATFFRRSTTLSGTVIVAHFDLFAPSKIMPNIGSTTRWLCRKPRRN